jgi:hypothetical protein
VAPIDLEKVPREAGCTLPMRLDAALLAPSKNRSGGRPTTSRDRPPYETTSKGTRFCMICKQPGHKSMTCPQRPPGVAKPQKEAKCSNCGLPGHRKNSCVKNDIVIQMNPSLGHRNRYWAKSVL